MFWTVLGAYLTGWLLVNLILNRLFMWATGAGRRNVEIKDEWRQSLASAVADEMILRRWKQYPYEDGEVLVLGPEIFMAEDDQGNPVICWQGENYVRP